MMKVYVIAILLVLAFMAGTVSSINRSIKKMVVLTEETSNNYSYEYDNGNPVSEYDYWYEDDQQPSKGNVGVNLTKVIDGDIPQQQEEDITVNLQDIKYPEYDYSRERGSALTEPLVDDDLNGLVVTL